MFERVFIHRKMKYQWEPEFPDSEFSSPDFESETASGANTRPIPIPSLYNSWITRPIPRPRRVLGRESRYFESETPFFTIKRYYFCPNLDENTARNVFTSPRPSLVKAIDSSPSPRLRRVLSRETRDFESETRDSGKFWSLVKSNRMKKCSFLRKI